MVQGPWGPWDRPFCVVFGKFVLWSGTYLEVFLRYLGVQGTPQLIYVISCLIQNTMTVTGEVQFVERP